jgi:hypothetical protein
MTTFYPFNSSRIRAPSYLMTFDGAQYTVTIIWNVSAQRFYILCQTTNNQVIFLVPLVASLPSIPLVNLEWDEYNSRVVVTTVNPHGFSLGQVIPLILHSTRPNIFNGFGPMTILNNTQFFYPMKQNPGQMTIAGFADYLISMTEGYFQSTLIYRNGMFEVNP